MFPFGKGISWDVEELDGGRANDESSEMPVADQPIHKRNSQLRRQLEFIAEQSIV